MKLKYRISKKAIVDLEHIWIYTCQKWSVEQADRYYNLIINEIEQLADNLVTGQTRDYLKPGYWVVKVKSHLIFYRKHEDDIVEIIRILHERMDIENRLME